MLDFNNLFDNFYFIFFFLILVRADSILHGSSMGRLVINLVFFCKDAFFNNFFFYLFTYTNFSPI